MYNLNQTPEAEEKFRRKNREIQRRYKERNREKVRQEAREYNAKKWAAGIVPVTDPKKRQARVIARSAVLAGTLIKPDCCSKCGGVDDKHRIHAHHSDYDKPLEVIWLCSICHGLERRIGDSMSKKQKEMLSEALKLLAARACHSGCEDGWYACPKSGDYIKHDDSDDSGCNCGGDEIFAFFDKYGLGSP